MISNVITYNTQQVICNVICLFLNSIYPSGISNFFFSDEGVGTSSYVKRVTFFLWRLSFKISTGRSSNPAGDENKSI